MPEHATEVLVGRRGDRSADRSDVGDDSGAIGLAPGAPVGSWRITSCIAEGGCGTVYAARHAVLDRRAAVKVLHASLASSPKMVERFEQEACAVNRIKHPNIIDIFDFGTLADGRPYFVMELLAADDLHQRVATGGRLTAAATLAVITPVCQALDAAHRAGYVHRDLKARNIGFARRPDGERVVLLDFGIAKLLEADRALAGTRRVGTPTCMAPEQIRGEPIDSRADVYALGVLLFHLLVGHYPFQGTLSEIEAAHLHAAPPVPSRFAPVPVAIDAVVTRALAKRPRDRQPSVLALLDELAAAVRAGARVSAPALAIRFVLALPEIVDDPELAAAAGAAARAAELMYEHGFACVLASGTLVLGADVLGGAPDAVRARAVAACAAIDRAVAALTSLGWRLDCREGTVEVDPAGALVDGPLLDLDAWP